MDAPHEVTLVHELTASVVANPTEGVAAAIGMTTPDREVALAVLKVLYVGSVLAVGVVGVSAVLMLTWGRPRQQSVELALAEDDGGRSTAEA